MTGYLLDTNVISMLSPSRQEATPAFLGWLEKTDADGKLFLSVISLQEIEKGISLLEHKGAVQKASALRGWLSGLVGAYDDKILALDAASAAQAGRLEARAMCGGHHPGMADAAIAGIAAVNQLTIVTRNAKHFEVFGVAVIRPEAAV